MEPEQKQDLVMEPGLEGEPEEELKDSRLLFVEPP